MAQQGRAGVALFITAIASFIGSIGGTIMLIFFSVPLAHLALRFNSPEYFSLMLLGLFAAVGLSSSGTVKSVAMVALGLVLGIIGVDVNTGISRFTFDLPTLYDGLSIVALALGLFGLPELIANAANKQRAKVNARDVSLKTMMPTREDWRRSAPAMTRGMGIGAFFGVLPGAGGLIASFISYAVEKQVSKNPSEFGKGAIEGISGPETANNAAIQTAFIPTLSLGIPGDAVMALMLGALLIHGITPGPQLVIESPSIFWGLVFSFIIGNVMLLLLNVPLIGLWVRVLSIPHWILGPSIVVFVCIGVYSVKYATGDIFVVMAFGMFGFAMRLFRWDAAALLLGFILGPMMEENLRRSLLLSRGSFMTFIERPFSLAFILAALAMLVLSIVRTRRARAKALLATRL